MSEQAIVECVPNFAEGRDRAAIAAIVLAMRLPAVHLLDLACDPVANRTVVTLAGPADAVAEAALRGAGEAVARIDLTRNSSNRSGNRPGSHPRIGAIDVLPFAPLAGSSLSACAALARETADALWSRYSLPAYLYAAAASRPDRVMLEGLRRGQFEGLRESVLRDASRRPDTGGPGLHPTAGICAVGARGVLVEYRIRLEMPEIRVARAVARELGSGSGGLGAPAILPLLAEGVVELGIVLARWGETGSIGMVHAAIVESVRRHRGRIASSRLIGLLPEAAFASEAAWASQLEGFDPAAHILERRMRDPLAWIGE